jgi:DNA-binding GntR family transcriptional regulator
MTLDVRAGLSAVVNTTKTDAAYGELRRGILHGSIPPGAFLEQEVLAAQLQLSTTPVREALRLLEAEGLVESVAFRKVRVTLLSRRELRELYLVRQNLDPLAASLAASAATDEQIARTQQILLTGELKSEERLIMNREFHRSIYVASGNSVLIDFLDSLWDRADRYRFVLAQLPPESPDAVPANPAAADKMHLAMVDALIRRDAEELSALMRDHLTGSILHLDMLSDDLERDGVFAHE